MRKTKKFLHDKTIYNLQALVPADFLAVDYFPLSYYVLKEEVEKKQRKEIKREWKIKPKKDIDQEEKLEIAINLAYTKGIISPVVHEEGLFGKIDLRNIKKNKELYDGLFASIYALTFNLTAEQITFGAQEIISREFARHIGIKMELTHIEPYSMIKDLSKEIPELYNPKRYCFNNFIVGEHFEMKREQAEEAQKEWKK